VKRVPVAHYVLFLALATSGAALDLWTKTLVFGRLDFPGKHVIWPGVFSFTTSYNRGALWGIGAALPHPNIVFAGLSLLAGLAILYWLFWYGAAKDRILTASLGLIMAGTVGNGYDRLAFGQVRDFLYFELINWPIFNVADSFLVCGATLLVIQAVFGGPAEAPESPPAGVAEIPDSELKSQASPLNSSSA
jgi:signal peptidase II